MTTTEAEYLSRLRNAVVAMTEMQRELDAVTDARHEPIAIVGMACRFPGGAATPEAFWNMLAAGKDAIVEVPAERWADDPFSHGDAALPEERSTRWGAFLQERLDHFEPQFFGLTPREAINLDPQQRLLLEVAWEALERAGLMPDQLTGTRTGVFLGINTNDYEQYGLFTDPSKLDIYTAIGNGHCFPPGRLSYALGLQGPSLAVDTACSSSLVAVHLACQSLRNGESAMAIAAGVNVMVLPWLTYIFARSQALSPDGRCKTFDAQANGYVRGEGCGVIVLKRLSDAQAAGDRVLALIRGSAVNQDGRSTGLTAPNVLAQQAMLRQALDSARLSPEDISFVETHGTGTALGDPIEVQAIAEVLGPARADGSTCVLGAVKTNVGHLEAAAGIAGLIKTVLALQHEQIPSNLHFKKLNPRISLEGTSLELATQARAWPRTDKPRFAGVNSFGISGTNAHVILEEAPAEAPPPASAESTRVLPLSARTPESLRALAQAYVAQLATPQPDADALDDLTYTASVKRGHFRHRLAVVGKSPPELADGLAAFVRGERPAGVATGEAPGTRRKLVFVFPGQGSQWLGMAQQLIRDQPVFRAALETCAAAIERETGWALLAELAATKDSSRLDHIDVIQPALFAIAVALAALWRSWGFEPDAVVGHSMGEVAAAHVAGALSLDDAARIICRRSKLLRTVSGKGAMAAVELSLDDTRAALAGYEHRLAVAVSNGPRATVISGEPAALDELIAKLEPQGVFCRRIKVDVASHSPLMDGLRPELERALAGVTPAAPTIAMLSTVTGRPVQPGEVTTSYWLDNLRQPVLFAHAVRALIDSGHDLFVELSPHPILVPPVEEALRDAGKSGAAVGSLRRDQDESRVLHEAIAALYAAGANVDWARLYAQPARVVTLPTYPWHRARFWVDDTMTEAPLKLGRVGRMAKSVHPLLGAALSFSLQPDARCFEQQLGLDAAAYLTDHRVQGEAVLPGAAYVEMALAAAGQAFGDQPHALEAIAFEQMLVLPARGAHTVQVALSDDAAAGVTRIQVASLHEASGAWIRHASGRLRRGAPTTSAAARETPAQIQARCPTVLTAEVYYPLAERQGVTYGPAFQGMRQCWHSATEVIGHVRLPDSPAAQLKAYRVHPALLDACIQALGGLLFAHADASTTGETYVPVGIEHVRLHKRPAREVWVHGWPRAASDGATPLLWDLDVLDDAGTVLVELRGLRVQRLDGPLSTRPPGEDWLHSLVWQRQDAPAPSVAPPGAWLIVQDRVGTGAELARLLHAAGDRVVRVVRAARNARIEHGLYEADGSAAGFTAALTDAFTGTPCRGVLYLWGLDAPSGDDEAALDHAQALGCLGALALTQATVRHNFAVPPRLWVVTRGAQPVGTGALAVAQAPLWGFGRALMLEHPELGCARVDLAPGDEPADGELRALITELRAGSLEDQIALRRDGRYVARLERTTFDRVGGEPRPLADDATYLITGGLSGLGLQAARWLAHKGARHLALVARSAPGPAAQAAIAELTAAGVTVRVARVDLADRTAVAGLLSELAATMPPLRGVLHAAAILDDRTVLELDPARFTRVMAPKLHGAWNLHVLTRALPLDFFVMYSSGASLLGSPGQANYAAANAFLDALAHARRRDGVPGLAINWGAFSEVGLAAAQANRGDRLAERGVASMTPAQGHAVLDRLLTGPAAQVGVMRLDARTWLGFYPGAARSPLWSALIEPGSAAPSTGVRDRLLAAAPAERQALLERFLAEQTVRILRLDASTSPSVEETFSALGMDSLMGLELRNQIEAGIGLRLSATLLFTYPTLRALAQYLLAQPGLADDREDVIAADAVAPSGASWFGFVRANPAARTRVFCIPGVGASASFFKSWSAFAGDDLELYPIELPGHGARLAEPHVQRLDVLVPMLARALAPHLDRRYALFGHSFGALIAFELMRHLRARRMAMPVHAFLAAFRPPSMDMPSSIGLELADREFLALVRQRGFITQEFSAFDDELIQMYLPVLRKDMTMLEAYRYQPEPPLDVPLSIFGSRHDRITPATGLGQWQAQTRGAFALDMFDGDHFFPRVEGEALLAIMRDRLA